LIISFFKGILGREFIVKGFLILNLFNKVGRFARNPFQFLP